MIENKDIPGEYIDWMDRTIAAIHDFTRPSLPMMREVAFAAYRHLNTQPSYPRLINVRVEATEATKEDIILKAIIQNTGIRADSYLDAIQHFWLTFDPTPAMNVVKKAMDAWVNAQPSPVLRFIKAGERLPELPNPLPPDTPEERGVLFVNRKHSAAQFWYPSYGYTAEAQFPLEADVDRKLYDVGWGREEWEWLEEEAPSETQSAQPIPSILSILQWAVKNNLRKEGQYWRIDYSSIAYTDETIAEAFNTVK